MKALKTQFICSYSFNNLVPVRETKKIIFSSIFITKVSLILGTWAPIVDHRDEDTHLSLTCGRLCVDRGSSSTAARAGQSVKRRPEFQPQSHPSAGWALKDEMQGNSGCATLPHSVQTSDANFNKSLPLSSLTLDPLAHSKLLWFTVQMTWGEGLVNYNILLMC